MVRAEFLNSLQKPQCLPLYRSTASLCTCSLLPTVLLGHHFVTPNCPDQHCTPCARHCTNNCKDGSGVVEANGLALLSSLAISGNPQIKMVLLSPSDLEALLQPHSWLEGHQQQQLLSGSPPLPPPLFFFFTAAQLRRDRQLVGI